MRADRWFNWAAAAATFLLLAGCASPVAEPDPAVRLVLAPSGKLRVGLYPGSPTSMIRNPASGEARGVGHDLGRELARRLGVAFEPVEFVSNAEVLEAVKAGRVDVTFTNATAVRARYMDFTPAILDVEQGYIVPAGSPIASAAEVDRPGVKVGVSRGSTSQSVLPRELKNAEVVPAPSLKAASEMLSQRKVDAFATNKTILFEMSDGLPGSRVLEGRWGLEHFALGIPKGREQAMPFLRKFAEDCRSEGVVKQAVERAGLRGTVSAESR